MSTNHPDPTPPKSGGLWARLFGMKAPINKTVAVATPGGLRRAASSNLAATLSNPLDPLSLISLTATDTIDGRTTIATYTAATKVFATTTPEGRTSSSTVDSLGRLVSDQFSGLDPTSFTYDSRGRMATVTQGSGPSARTATFTFNPEGFVQSLTDAIGRTTHFTYDAAGRVVSKTFPDTRVATFSYDAAGNMVSAAPPGRPAHTFAYSDRNEPTVLTPPPVSGSGPTSYDHNLDKQVTTTVRPDGRTITLGYDASGRLSTRTLATNNIATSTDTRSYDAAGRLARIASTSGVATDYAYDGLLRTEVTWSGPVGGNVSRRYDNSFRPVSQSVNGANAINLSYDNDDLLIGVGDLTITRSPQSGFPTGSSLGIINVAVGFNGFGELVSYDATAGANSIFRNAFTRDALGRLVQKTETIGGVTDAYGYTYDVAGQLTRVDKNGVAAEAYAYDANGNRIGATVGGSSITASYDDQDRLSQYGAATFTYNGAGDLLTKTSGTQTNNYQYDQLGNLLGATLANGTAVTYVIDGSSRRIGKKLNGTLTKGFLYGDRLRIAAELDGAGTVVSRFVYGANHYPLYMVRGGVALRIITDQVGSVRLVINSATGSIVQRMDYDSFGNVTQDTAPGFQPFGFGGGIYDPDTALVRFGARDYDPAVGRWTTKDPISFAGLDGNLYRYVGNQPVNQIDPVGLGKVADIIGGYMDALLDSYKAAFLLPLTVIDYLNFLGITNIQYREGVYGPLGIDDKSDSFKYSKLGCELIGGGVAGVEAVAAARAKAAAEALEFIIESDEVVAKQIEKAARQRILDSYSQDLKQILAEQRGSANKLTK